MTVQPLLDMEIRYSTLVRADPELVWEALTTADGLNRWFTTGMDFVQEPGAEMTWRWRDWGVDRITAEVPGKVLEVNRPRRFVFEWGADNPTTVEIDFTQVNGGARIDLCEHGYPDTPAGRRSFVDCACGWGEALTLVKFFVEHAVTY